MSTNHIQNYSSDITVIFYLLHMFPPIMHWCDLPLPIFPWYFPIYISGQYTFNYGGSCQTFTHMFYVSIYIYPIIDCLPQYWVLWLHVL